MLSSLDSRFVWAPLLLGLAIAAGCHRDGLNRAEVHGNVTLDGKPVEQGSIHFVPIQGTPGPAVGGEIRNGQYRLAGDKGPMVGWNRVEVHASQKTGRRIPKGRGLNGETVDEMVEGVAAKYNTGSTLKVEIRSGDNTADFAVESK